MKALDAINNRHSVRSYTDEPLKPELLDAIITAGESAAIGKADYEGCLVTVITDKTLIDKIEKAASTAAGKEPGNIFYGAPQIAIVSSCEGKPKGIDYANAACIIENMMIACSALNVGSLFIFRSIPAFTHEPALKAELGLPEGFEVKGSMAFGYTDIDMSAMQRRGKVRFVKI